MRPSVDSERLHDRSGAQRRSPVRVHAAIASAAFLLALVAVLCGCSSSHTAARPSAKHAMTTRSTHSPQPADTPTAPIDARYLTEVPFGTTSFWIQPWRAYLDTWPASRLQAGLGINFNVKPAAARDTARLLHDIGFKLARIELGWGGLSYSNPTRFTHEADVRTRLAALHEYGLRPLILLNANSGAPCPARKITLETTQEAQAGATTVMLSPASAANVVPGKSGFDAVVFREPGKRHRHRRHRAAANAPRLSAAQRRARKLARRAKRRERSEAGVTQLVLSGNPALLITKVSSSGLATLSKPLPAALAAGAHKGSTLLYAPFADPTLPDGAPNPTFQATLHGWLSYVATVSRQARSIFGPGGYDMEVWNELGFGSQFLNVGNYEAAPSGTEARAASKATTKAVTRALLEETVAYVRNPANGISPAVGVSNGFASQSPFPSPAFAPAGLTAYSKHPYAGPKLYPAEFQVKGGNAPRNALGQRDTAGPRRSAGARTPLFVPQYQSDFPEHDLTAGSAETLIRDVAPITTHVYRAPHGRYVARAHQRPPQVWVTEYNLGSGAGTIMGSDGHTPQSSVTLSAADRAHFQAKVVLRSLVSMIAKGVSREYFFAAAPGNLSLINENFFTELEKEPNTYPGDNQGGETMSTLHNLITHFQGPGPTGGNAQQLTLQAITQEGNHAQFTGDGTPQHPSLYDRNVLAVFPFQTSPTSYVIPIYVMTRDLLTLYEPNQPTTDTKRFDLPNETFHITLTGLPNTTNPPTITLYDPITNQNTPTQLTSQNGTTATIQIQATDYPRLLTLNYAGK